MSFFGAINKNSKKYTTPNNAYKTEKYECYDCKKTVILCKGKVIRPYFRHLIDTINPCTVFNNPTESHIHKESKFLIKDILEKGIDVYFERECTCCGKAESYKIPQLTDSSLIIVEYRFKYNDSVKIADVGYIDNGEIVCLFEARHTHKTDECNRFGSWFEFDAGELVKMINTDSYKKQYIIPCLRTIFCYGCIESKRNYELITENNKKREIVKNHLKCLLSELLKREKENEKKKESVKKQIELIYSEKYRKYEIIKINKKQVLQEIIKITKENEEKQELKKKKIEFEKQKRIIQESLKREEEKKLKTKLEKERIENIEREKQKQIEIEKRNKFNLLQELLNKERTKELKIKLEEWRLENIEREKIRNQQLEKKLLEEKLKKAKEEQYKKEYDEFIKKYFEKKYPDKLFKPTCIKYNDKQIIVKQKKLTDMFKFKK